MTVEVRQEGIDEGTHDRESSSTPLDPYFPESSTSWLSKDFKRETVLQTIEKIEEAMERYSLSSTYVDSKLVEKSPAEALAVIKIDDPNLQFTLEELQNPSDEVLSLAVPLVLAKAEIAKKENPLTKKEKEALSKLTDQVFQLIGGRKNTARALAAVTLLATACSRIPISAEKLTPVETLTSSITPSPTAEPTKTPTAEPTETPTPTETQAPTATPETAPRPEMIQFPGMVDNVDLNINGRTVPLSIGTERESNILNTWSKWGITGFGVNPELPNFQQKLSLMVTGALWQDSGAAQKSYDEFMQNPDQYPISLVMPDGKGGTFTKTFVLNDINRIEYRYVDFKDPRLYLTTHLSLIPSGYQWDENGTLIMYTTTLPDDGQLNIIYTPSSKLLSYKGRGLEQSTATVDQGDMLWTLLYVTYTPSITESAGQVGGVFPDSRFLDRLKKVADLCEYPTAATLKAAGIISNSATMAYLQTHSFWTISLDNHKQ